MNHIRNFWGDYWVFITGVIIWALLIGSCWVIPPEWTYLYVIIWAGLGSVVAGIFVLGYMRYSKPTKDQVTRKRTWSGTWAWLLTESMIVFLVVGWTCVLRLINISSAIFTEDRIYQYQLTSAIFITVFVQQVWLLWMWVAQQLETRARLRSKISVR